MIKWSLYVQLHRRGGRLSDRGPGRALRDPARPRPDARLHAGGDAGHGEVPRPHGAARPGGPDGARQHLPPLPAPRGGDGGPPGRPAPLHGLGRSPAHRLRRLPGLQPGPPAPPGRGRGHLPLPHRRQRAPPDPRGGHPGSGAARGGRDHGLRRVPGGPRHLRAHPRGPRPHPALGRALPAGPHPPRPGPVRDRPGGPLRRPAPAGRPGHRRPGLPRLRHRGGQRGREQGRLLARLLPGRPCCSPPGARAT